MDAKGGRAWKRFDKSGVRGRPWLKRVFFAQEARIRGRSGVFRDLQIKHVKVDAGDDLSLAAEF